MLAGFGAILGLVLSAWLLRLLKLAPVYLPRLNEASLNGAVLGFALAACVVSAVAFGLLPAIQATRGDLQQPLKESARALSGGYRWKRVLIAGEVGLTVVLLVGAALLFRTLLRMIETDLGFRPDHLLTMRISLPTSKYQGKVAQAFYSRLLEQVSSLPGVRVAGLISRLPPDDYGTNGNFRIHGRPPVRNADAPFAEFRIVSPNYFSAMGIPLLRGRFLTAQDRQGAPCVLLINQALARAYWPNGDALGSRIEMSELCTIVGIVQDVKNHGLQQKPEPEMYMSYLQETPVWLARMSLVVRTGLDPRQLVAAVRAEVSRIDPAQRVTHVRTMEERLSDVVSQPRFRAVLIGAFAGLALLLALIGLYGVIGYEVTRRTHEIGVRMALGAGRQEVVRMVIGQGLRLVVTGVTLGVAGALALTRVLSGFLYGVSPRDPGSFVVVSALVIAMALVATYVPARRAARVDPMEALHYE